MTEKTKTLVAGTVMLLVQVIVAWAVWLSTWCMARGLADIGCVTLPCPADIALRHGQTIPIVAALLTIIAVVFALKHRDAVTRWLLPIAVFELIALSVFVAAITMPALTITHALGP